MSPSKFDSWADVHTEGAKRIWYVKEDSSHKKTYVYVDLEDSDLRTSIKWDVFGTQRKVQTAKQGSYKLAVDLDDWFRARKEPNKLPQVIKDEMRQRFIEHLGINQES